MKESFTRIGLSNIPFYVRRGVSSSSKEPKTLILYLLLAVTTNVGDWLTVSLRSKRFLGVEEHRESQERDFRVLPARKTLFAPQPHGNVR